jgi:hypothetical protein
MFNLPAILPLFAAPGARNIEMRAHRLQYCGGLGFGLDLVPEVAAMKSLSMNVPALRLSAGQVPATVPYPVRISLVKAMVIALIGGAYWIANLPGQSASHIAAPASELILPIVVNGAVAETLHYQTIFTMLNASLQEVRASLQVFKNDGKRDGVFCSPLAPPPSGATIV